MSTDILPPALDARRQTGRASYEDGVAAEDGVARHYEGLGARVVARRWRGPGGEIDLVCMQGHDIVFVEVKKAETHDEAAMRLSGTQLARICASAEAWLADHDGGLACARVDLALVDGAGRIAVIENVSLV